MLRIFVIPKVLKNFRVEVDIFGSRNINHIVKLDGLNHLNAKIKSQFFTLLFPNPLKFGRNKVYQRTKKKSKFNFAGASVSGNMRS